MTLAVGAVIEGVNELRRTRGLPLLARRGGRDINRDIAKLPLMERTGWWFKTNRNVLNLNHHPVCAASDASLFLLTGAATPPGQKGQSARSPQFVKRNPSSAGVTLIELIVVLVILGVVVALVGPSMFKAADRFALNSTGRRVVATLRAARNEARSEQRQLMATLSEGELVVLRDQKRVAAMSLPEDLEVDSAARSGYVLLPSGQVLGPQRLELRLRDRYRAFVVLGPGPGTIRFEEGR